MSIPFWKTFFSPKFDRMYNLLSNMLYPDLEMGIRIQDLTSMGMG